MKKLIILMLCIVTLGLASCKKDTVYVPDTNYLPNKTIIAYVNPADWKQDTDGQTLYSIINISDVLDAVTFEDDGILVYVSRGDNDTYEQIPNVYSLNSYSYLVDKFAKTIEIDLQRSDRTSYPTTPTTRTRVKIVLVRSQK
ncbi:hypothetical protein [Pedobacter nototheniae]|uniref:hypothetical protein n=1 Tax=Pedobacter nototheniae TaxID=2488994 RepID=UPI00103B2904|nr:hypothetical protein [Pedobacter nototheniae]